MTSQSKIEFFQVFGELSQRSRRDITHGLKLARYQKTARSMLGCDPVSGNTLLGLLACFEHDIPAMHAHHKKAIELEESCFTLVQYAVSLDKSCLWSESLRFALLAHDLDPSNPRILDAIIKLVPLTGRFSLYRSLLPLWQATNAGVPHVRCHDHEVVSELLAKHRLLERDLKELISALGDAFSRTEIVLRDFRYDIVRRGPGAPFLHFRFLIPDEFAASYYEDLIYGKLSSTVFHPRLFDAFSWSIENSAVYRLYECMEKECRAGEADMRAPDPELLRQIGELVEGVECSIW